jgi:2-C-methyl-D-erythritol 4-phosphate cytidylyltransferase
MDHPRLSLAIVVAAAGQGVRFESRIPKQHVPLLGIPMLQRALTSLNDCECVDALAVAVGQAEVEQCRHEIESERIGKVVAITAGGDERSLSVKKGLEALTRVGTWDLVGVHDGARPLVSCADVDRAAEVLAGDPELEGVILGVPSRDTIKVADAAGVITQTPDRRSVWRAQTPQIFRWHVLLNAYEQAEEVLREATDDASLVERLGGRVKVVAGSPENLKITDRGDWLYAEQLLAERRR